MDKTTKRKLSQYLAALIFFAILRNPFNRDRDKKGKGISGEQITSLQKIKESIFFPFAIRDP
jgi:hypothetical protein